MNVGIASLERAFGQRTGPRSIYVFTSVLFLVTAVVGFGPKSINILRGTLPFPPLAIHVHGAIMVSWLLLLIAQTSLAATGRLDLHRRLGVVSLVLAPLIFAAMIVATRVAFDFMSAQGLRSVASNLLLVQIRSIVLFPVFYLWAISSRRSAPDVHKRMMLMATLVLIDAALGRMHWLPFSSTTSYTPVHMYLLLLIVPALLYDLKRLHRVHRAYVIGLGLFIPWMIATALLWNTPWWQAEAPILLGAH